MSAFEEHISHSVSISNAVRQMYKGQDQAYDGTFVDKYTGETGKWAMITDGHGNDKCISYLRSIPHDQLDRVIGLPNPAETLFEMVNKFARVNWSECSGATLNLVKVYRDRLVCINVGDSQAAVYKNGELVFLTEFHDSSNPVERERLIKENPSVYFSPSKTCVVTTDGKMYRSDTEYVYHTSCITLALTQALGHCGVTGCSPSTTIIPYGPDDTVRVVIASDGFWDMVAENAPEEKLRFADMSSDELLKFAVDRWLQPWDMYMDRDKPEFQTCSYTTNECDDVSVVKIDILPGLESV
jgi:serine/threonine protein phosphatase PrpC